MANETVSDRLARRGARMRLYIALLFVGLILLQVGVFVIVIAQIWGESVEAWFPELLISSAILLVGGLLALVIIATQQRKTGRQISLAINREMQELSLARNRARALQAQAAAVGSARNVEDVFDVTLDVYQLILNDLGTPAEEQISAVLLPDVDDLLVSTSRGLAGQDEAARLSPRQGIVGQALSQARLLVSDRPDRDPALSSIKSLADRQQVICVPLRAAYDLYGLVILGLDKPLSLSEDDVGLLEAIADQATMALHNFQALQELDLIRRQYLEDEEEERQLVRRALHEGPSRSVAAVALRLGLIRTMMIRDAKQAAQELGKIESQTRRSSLELRSMVSLLRPLALDAQNLERAVEATLQKIEDGLGLELRFGRRAPGERLSEMARAVILFVIEASLAWAKRHGQATAAEVHMWREDDVFWVTIDDNRLAQPEGKENTVARGDDLDFSLMRVKAKRVGGQLEIQSKPGRGVTTLLSIPLQKKPSPGV